MTPWMKPTSSQRATRSACRAIDAFEQRVIGALGMRQLAGSAGDDVIRQPPHAIGIAARREDTGTCRRGYGWTRRAVRTAPGSGVSRITRSPVDHGGERARGRDAKRRHRLADDVFAQHRTERGAAVAAARERRRAGPLELDVAADAVRVDHLAEQDGAAVAELGHEMAELVAGIGHRDRVRAVGNAFSGEDFGPLRASEHDRDRDRDGSPSGRFSLISRGDGDGRRRDAARKVRRQRRIGVLEREMDRHGLKIGMRRE